VVRDRLLLIMATVAALVVLPLSALLLKDVRFLILLMGVMALVALGYSLAIVRSWKLFWTILAIEVLLAGIAGGVYYRHPLRLALDVDYRAGQVVLEMLENCTRPAPEREQLRIEREQGDRWTHVVAVEVIKYNYGTWRVHADKGQVFPVEEWADLLISENRCRPLNPRE
jgi:hypothetical protein